MSAKAQIAMGGITAHYAVEENSFYGFPLPEFLPYVVIRTIHTQLADGLLGWMFWGLNVGLAMMVFMSLVPAAVYQAVQAMAHGLWFARSPELCIRR